MFPLDTSCVICGMSQRYDSTRIKAMPYVMCCSAVIAQLC